MSDIDILQPIPVTVVRFECPTCGHRASSKSRTREHMKRCWWDPENRGCKTCVNFERVRCCGAPDLYGCYVPACPTGDECAVGIDMTTEATGPGPLAINCPSWQPKPAVTA